MTRQRKPTCDWRAHRWRRGAVFRTPAAQWAAWAAQSSMKREQTRQPCTGRCAGRPPRDHLVTLPNRKPQIHGDIVIPQRNLDLSLIVYRNVDVSLPASHIVELSFRGQAGRDPIERIAGIIIRDASEAAGKPLVGASTKVVDGFFLFALSGASQDVSANVALLDKAAWIDIPVLYRSGRRALISIQKGGGNSVFTAAIADWQT